MNKKDVRIRCGSNLVRFNKIDPPEADLIEF